MAAPAGSSVAALKNNLAINPAALLPGQSKATSKASNKDALTTDLDAFDPNNPADADRLLKIARDLRDQAAQLTRAQRELIASNKSLREEVQVYSRVTLPHAVMAKFDRDSTGTGATELAELRRVRHIHSGGTWYKAADLSSADAERLADQNAEASSNAQQSGGVDPVFRSGWMFKEGSVVRNWKRRLFILYGSSIEYYAKASDDSPKGVIKLDTCTLSPVQNRAGVEKPCMELVFSAKARKWRFTAEKLSDNKRWYAAINNRLTTLSYIHRCEQSKQQPDARLLEFLNTVPPNSSAPVDDVDKPRKGSHSVTNSYIQKPVTERWPASHPLILNGRPLSLDAVSVIARLVNDTNVCPGGGVSVLECVSANLTPVEVEVLAKALVESEFNVAARDEVKAQSLSAPDAGSGTDLAPDYSPTEEDGLRVLNLSHNVLVNPKDAKLAALTTLSRFLLVNTSLTELVLSDCKLGDEGAAVLAAVLPERTCPLRRLVLSRNDITCKGAIALAAALSKGTVEAKHRKDKARENAKSVLKGEAPRASGNHPRTHTLVELVLDHNSIGDEGGKALAQVLQNPQAVLQEVMLQHNRIGDAGAAAIAQAVRGNVASKLTLLDLSENPLSAEKGAAGGKALAHMAQVNRSLHTLKFLNFVLNDATLNSLRLLSQFGYDAKQPAAT